jgi:hypothetical protein
MKQRECHKGGDRQAGIHACGTAIKEGEQVFGAIYSKVVKKL